MAGGGATAVVRVGFLFVMGLGGHSSSAVTIPLGSQQGAVATVHREATQAATRALNEGGNAVDAAIAAALMLGVVDGHDFGIGGGCLALVRLKDGRILAVDGRETAPAAATRDMFVPDGRAVPALSATGASSPGGPRPGCAATRASSPRGTSEGMTHLPQRSGSFY